MELREIKIADIQANPAQPEIRTTKQALRGLKESIETHGLLMPVSVRVLANEKYEQIDGHRRVTCLSELGFNRVLAIVYNGELNSLNSIQAFRITNEHTRNISALEYLDIYLNGGEVPHSIMKVLLFIVDKLGRKTLRKLKNNKLSPYNVTRIHPLYKKLYANKIPFVDLFEWALKHKMFRVLNVYEKLNNSEPRNARLLECIKNDTPFEIN